MRARAEENLARVVLSEYLALGARETVTIETWSHGLPWARALVVEARRIGAEPLLAVEDEEAFFRTLAAVPRRVVPSVPPTLVASSDAYVYLGGPEEFPRLFGLPSDELRALVTWHSPAWRKAAQRARVRIARLSIAAATPTAAARYATDLEAWRDELLAASSIGPDRLAAAARSRVRRLARARHLRIRHANGTDLRAELLTGRYVVEDGRHARDLPDHSIDVPTGRIVAFLRGGSTQGCWEANRPIFDRFAPTPVQLGARFQFARGRLREFSFDRGGESFAAAYARGGRGHDLPGAIVFGINPRIVRAPEVGDLAEGTVSLVLGGNRVFGGRNRASFSVTTTLAEADVDLDGRPWLIRGRPVA